MADAIQPALLVQGEDTHGNWDLLPPDGPSGFVYKPKPDGAATTVILHQVLHFLDDPQRALNEAARIVTPGGHIVIADFGPHEIEELREAHAHRRLGFADAEMQAM